MVGDAKNGLQPAPKMISDTNSELRGLLLKFASRDTGSYMYLESEIAICYAWF